MFSPAIKRNIARIIPFAVFWLVFSIVYSLLERGLLGKSNVYPSTGNPYDFHKTIWVTAFTAVITGCIIGSIEIFYLNRLFQKKSFAKKLLFKTLIYLGLIILFLLGTTMLFNASLLDASLNNPDVWKNVYAFFSSYAFWSVCIYIAVAIGVSLFYAEVSDNLGQSVLHNFITGKYHRPKQENRIFMFLDMKSSTTIAEQMGHVHYFEMLKEYFADMSVPIIRYSGEIYQYVGDEIVISWPLHKGIYRNNCVNCFYAIRAALARQKEKYHFAFEVFPEFKAGLHCGKVTAGEIGTIKKEIVFTGDVLNTAARIQGLCNTYESDILLSGELLEKLDLQKDFTITPLGENELRGRDEKISLFTINKKEER
ncbi:adenylate/guanylate cyclase domain-containing protein [Ferruginibacter sp. HRS2-29]|uniref:adenylate/guanylate cyclase domain-containing protein n=1 Tax=Ferruginibacter sp. HRS2-29 TaxID=2487334 RepID=UPI0020CC2F55|nr:adenylate/guanylate cyclase domain-containing protein [Ferruginibacter sp. HRS2-29]MCP9751091.1 adenylate/guanylate cyclase domain-containing protein [Ferruginibacter sp. HRS2-29]